MTDIAWHFTGSTLRDGSPIPPIGHTLVYQGRIRLCAAGYHWSRTPWQALLYAPGHLLHKVRVGGEIIEDSDKGVSSMRTILASIDATHLLRRFAADQALSVAHLWEMPDTVRDYLTTLDEGKRTAAWDAAWDATRAATRAAAWDAAGDAAGDALADTVIELQASAADLLDRMIRVGTTAA